MIENLINLGTGKHRIRCECAAGRSGANRVARTLSVDIDSKRAVWTCHHCGTSGSHFFNSTPIKEEEPAPMQFKLTYTPLREEHVAWLAGRGISLPTAEKAGVMATTCFFRRLGRVAPAIAFPYKGAYKIRSIEDKDFANDGSPAGLWLSPIITNKQEIVITEGEMDALACMEAGIEAVSIPSGAGNKFTFLETEDKLFSSATRVVLALDNDQPGIAMANELARRLGKYRCYKIDIKEKDLNELLMATGTQAVKNAIEQASHWPVEGLYDAGFFKTQVDDIYLNGMGTGLSTGFGGLDSLYSVVPGLLTIVTGYPGGGKSELVDQLMVNLARDAEWKFGIASFENPPKLHIAKLMAKWERKPFFDGATPRMSTFERDRSFRWVNDHFFFIHNDDGSLCQLDSLIDRIKTAVMRYGIRGVVIDPYNYIARPKDANETEWVSDMLTQLCSTAKAYGLHVWFIAHPSKQPPAVDGKTRIPDGNSISGSAHFWNKADFGITVHRPRPKEDYVAEVHVWKSRFSWLGKQGSCELLYDPASFSYEEIGGAWDDATVPANLARAIKYSAFDEGDLN